MAVKRNVLIMTVKDLKDKLNKFDDQLVVMIPNRDLAEPCQKHYVVATHLSQGFNEFDGCLFISDYIEDDEEDAEEAVCLGKAISIIQEESGTYNKTNADYIRAMTNEELAKYLINFKNTFGKEYEGEMSCLDWLEADATVLRSKNSN